jgi:uncharacterized repeat protein (TIGR02059 family)
LKRVFIALFLIVNSLASAKTYYVSITGNNSNPGTITQPWLTWDKAFNTAMAGDTVYFRGGIYRQGNPTGWGINVSVHNGTRAHPICYFNYPGEEPVLDCSNVIGTLGQNFGLHGQEVYFVHFKGLTVENVSQRNNNINATGIFIRSTGNLILENMKVHNCGGPNITITDYDTIWIKNCDSWNTCDTASITGPGPGQNGTGIGCANSTVQNNVPYARALASAAYIENCRVWNFSDNGFATTGLGYIELKNCWAFNGGQEYISPGLYNRGDGCGFKFGAGIGSGEGTDNPLSRLITNCISAYNGSYGFAPNNLNANPFNVHLYNNFAYHNGVKPEEVIKTGFVIYDYIGSTPGPNEMYANNISYANINNEVYAGDNYTHNHNSWDSPVTVTDADFISLDTTGIRSKRGVISPGIEDWSMPDINFGKLAPGSDLIDAGVDVGLSYSGNAPDLGYYETGLNTSIPSPIYISSVVQNSTPSIIEITYNLTLANVVPAVSAFSVTVNSSSRTVNSVTVSGAKVLLTLSSPVAYGNSVTVAYTKPSSNPLQTSAGGEAASFSAKSVTNNVSPPSPVYVSSAIQNATPARLDISYSLSLASIVPAASAFSVSVNSNVRSINSVAVSGTVVSLTLSSAVIYGDVVTVAYTRPSSNPLQSTAGGQVLTFSAQTVINNVLLPVPAYVSSVIQNSTPSKLDITYSIALGNNVPATSVFSVTVNSAARAVSAVAVSGTTVSLALASPVVYGDAVNVAYTKPSSNPLQTAAGGQAVSFSAQKVTNNVASLTIPAYVSSSVENATPSKINIVYNLSLANTVPATSAFAVTVNSVARTVSSVAVSGTTVVLTLSSPIAHGDAVKVAYTKPSSNPLQTSAGGQAASFSAQTVTNNIQVINSAPVVMVNYKSTTYSGFVNELNASGSYDPNKDNLTFSWVVPSNISVSSTTGSTIQYLSPAADATQNVQFVVNVSDGKTTQSKTIPVQILPYEPGLEVAEVVKVEASNYLSPNYPANIIDGNIGTMWASNGDNEWLLLELKTAFSVQHVDLAFQPGQKRESFFDILGSEDMTTWETILSKSNSCAFSGALQVFDFPSSKTDKEFKYIKVIGHGNTTDAWNYISEFRIFGYKHKNPTSYEEQPVKIYPNPAKNYFNVRIDETSVVNDFLRIVSLTGKILFQEKIDPGVSEFRVPINLLKGIYLIQMGAGNLTLFSQKLVVSN